MYQIDPVVLKALLSGTRKNAGYAMATAKSDEMLLITEGKNVKGKLVSYRPTEAEEVKKYRLENFRLITKAPFSKILNSLSKIGRAEDFRIAYPPQAGVMENETLEDYCERNFPFFDSVANWFFSLGLKGLLTEPNGWICVLPTTYQWGANEYKKPFPYIFRADQVLDWSESEWIFILSDEKHPILDETGKVEKQGNIYLLVTKDSVTSYTDKGKTSSQNAIVYEPEELVAHNFGDLPAWRLGGIYCSASDPCLCESFVAPVVPYWTEALIGNSDKQGAIKQHAYPESEEWTLGTCGTCNGMGQVHQHGSYGNSAPVNCQKCNGTGNVPSPFGNRVRREPIKGEYQPPFPSKAYIDKDIKALEFMDKDVDANIYKGYAALNMEFLASVPVAQSGIAKQFDREELNSFLFTIARHVMENILKPCFWYIARWRYGDDTGEAALEAIVPTLTVPQNFDIAGLAAMESEIAAASTAKIDPRILNAMNISYARKRFRNSPETVTMIELETLLDPLSGKSEDDKMTIKANGGVTAVEYFLSANISTLLRLALEKDPKFGELPYSAQRTTLLGMATERQAEIAKAATVAIPTP